jgi:hypothetical protein
MSAQYKMGNETATNLIALVGNSFDVRLNQIGFASVSLRMIVDILHSSCESMGRFFDNMPYSQRSK